jgi:two-component system, chemotaxis family, response regulator Rcp1
MNQFAGGRTAEILLVEDNEDDVELMRIGFRRARFAVNLNHVPDGEVCMQYLRGEGPFVGRTMPDLVLLDLHMPRMSGREVLAAIVADDRLRQLPVIVLTTSEAQEDVLSSYKLRCSSYIVKPVDFEQFYTVVQGLTDYWFTLVVLPGAR